MDTSPSPVIGSSGGELKIKGQAELERRKGKWDAQDDVSAGYMLLFEWQGLIACCRSLKRGSSWRREKVSLRRRH
jgi:hypothetical protein